MLSITVSFIDNIYKNRIQKYSCMPGKNNYAMFSENDGPAVNGLWGMAGLWTTISRSFLDFDLGSLTEI